MNKISKIFLGLAVITLVVFGCRKEKDNAKPASPSYEPADPLPDPTNPNNGNPPGPNTAALAKLFADNSLPYKKLSINPSVTNSFYGNSGTRYIIKGNSLLMPDGTPATGPVDIEVREFLDRGDMIFSKMLPESNGDLLVSGGEIDIKATKNGIPLRLSQSAPLQVNVPQGGTPATDMSLFSGMKKTGDNSNQVNWVPVAPRLDSLNGASNTVITGSGDTLSIISDSLNWINIDKLMKQYPPKDIVLNMIVSGDTIPDSTGIPCYALFKDINAIRTVNVDVNTHIGKGSLPTLPTHYAAFTIIKGEFYGGTMLITPDGQSHNMVLSKTAPADFKKMLNQL